MKASTEMSKNIKETSENFWQVYGYGSQEKIYLRNIRKIIEMEFTRITGKKPNYDQYLDHLILERLLKQYLADHPQHN